MLYDHYVPDPPLHCPQCGTDLGPWQGDDGPSCLLVWRQGVAAPVEHRVEPALRVTSEAMRALRLPERFVIYPALTCSCAARYAALGTCEGGVWRATRIITTDEARAVSNPLWNT